MLDINIGESFPVKITSRSNDEGNQRPTIQFKVPNSDMSAELFSEYEVVINRKTSEIAVITGRRVYKTLPECEEGKNIALNWLKKAISNAQYSESENIYSSNENNVFGSLYCAFHDESPFPTLEFQFRGKKQDRELESAWESYFN
ncbi:hypothetical protein KOI40_04255 [Aestuariicella sp. G3-2]|uniref:hypothetical protein n=1 Tax=Pseudomaricurvus albidus TaxID=2842452 RepID=UPI001C0B8F00|nr:hypothetical protein [Aestuariicella albida]MBU3069019.1 hypothetical protein [Aestuariicella albida]